MTVNYDSFLVISFTENIEQNLEVIEILIQYPKKNEVLKKIFAGLQYITKVLGINYKLSRIYYALFSVWTNCNLSKSNFID